MKVQDTVGGATQDIYFDANNNLDEAAIVSYGGSNDVFVETWYDQSINGNNATQGTSSARPKIYDGTTGALVTENGKPALSLSNDFMNAANAISFSSDFFVSSVFNTNTTQSFNMLLGSYNDSKSYLSLRTNEIKVRNSASSINTFSGASISYNQQHLFTLSRASNSLQPSVDGSTQTAQTTSGTYNLDELFAYNSGLNAYRLGGNCQEVVLWASDKSTDRTSIESNIGDYYTQNTPLLDTYTGAAAAYSLRLLDSTYTGSAVQVQDTVGGATQDIGFNVFGELDTVSLAAYGGSNDVFVATWYDQSGNSNDATQPTSTSRPKIYDGTTGTVVDNNGKPTLSFINDNLALTNELFLRSNAPDAFLISLVAEGTEGTSNGEYFGGITSSSTNFFATYGSTNNYRWRHTNDAGTGNVNTSFAYPSPAPVVGEMSLLNLYIESSTKKMQFNGQQLTISGNTAWSSTSDYKFNLGVIGRSYARELNLQVSELVVWPNQSSTDLSEIQTNINDFYSIY